MLRRVGPSEHSLHFRLAPFPRMLSTCADTRKHCWGNIVSCYVFGVAKLAGSEQNVLPPLWLNEETLFWKIKGRVCA